TAALVAIPKRPSMHPGLKPNSSNFACRVATSGPDAPSCNAGIALPPQHKPLGNSWQSQRHAPYLVLGSLPYADDHNNTHIGPGEPDLYLQKCPILPANWLQNSAMPCALVWWYTSATFILREE